MLARNAAVTALVASLFSGMGWQAHAWQFSTRAPLCLLVHEEALGRVIVSYDTLAGIYAISVQRSTATWTEAPVFSMRFEGERGLTISTDRHRLNPGQSEVSVTDTGFGNVLNGLEFNRRATALLGDQAVGFDLSGAAEGVQAFRACTTAPAV